MPKTILIEYLLPILIRIGKRRTISTSKIRKIIANKKKRKENGNRADLIGSNPHSNGEFFSRSLIARLANTQPNPITTQDKAKATTLLTKLLNILALETYKSHVNQHQWFPFIRRSTPKWVKLNYNLLINS